MDGVVADIMSSWLQMYNRDYGDSIKAEDIVTRSIEKYVSLSAKMIFINT